MKAKKENIDKVSIIRASTKSKYYVKDIIEKAENVSKDPNKKDRLEKCLCTSCYYVMNGRIGGAAMTQRPCGICEEEMRFSSTCTDVICLNCANNNELCKHCGADIKLRVRRNVEIKQ